MDDTNYTNNVNINLHDKRKQHKTATTDLSPIEEKLKNLEAKLNHQSTLTETLWALIQQQGGCTTEQLETEFQKTLLLREQRSNQKLTCEACNMANPNHMTKCMYCGGKLEAYRKSLFE